MVSKMLHVKNKHTLRNKHTLMLKQRAFMKLIILLLTKYNFVVLQYFTQSVSHCVLIYIFIFHFFF